LPAVETATAIKNATGPMTVRARKPDPPATEIRWRIAVIDTLDDLFAIAAVAKLGVVFECVEADAAGSFTSTMPPKGAAPAGAQEIVLAEIPELDAMPGLAPAGATIIPPAIPAPYIASHEFSKSIG
jgi:hypothetical protein